MIRRILLAGALWLGLAVPAAAAVAVVQCSSNSSSPTTCTTTTNNGCVVTAAVPSAVTSTNLAVLFVHEDAGGLTSVGIQTPSGWTAGPNLFVTSSTTNDLEVAVFYRTGFTGTTQAVTLNATTGGSTYYGAASMCELSGANNSNPTNASGTGSFTLGVTTGGTGTGATGVTPTTSGTLALGLWGWNDNNNDAFGNTVQSGWTAQYNPTNSPVNSAFASTYIASLASPTSGVGLTSTLNIVGSAYVSPNWMNLLWIINPAGFPAASTFGLYPHEGAYPGGQP